MKKILYIFLTISFLSFTVIPAYIYAEDTVTSAEEEETSNTEDSSSTEETTLTDSLNEESDDTDNGITVWTVIIAVLGGGLFIGLAYYIVKNFNL
jgi:hypothetical protein